MTYLRLTVAAFILLATNLAAPSCTNPNPDPPPTCHVDDLCHCEEAMQHSTLDSWVTFNAFNPDDSPAATECGGFVGDGTPTDEVQIKFTGDFPALPTGSTHDRVAMIKWQDGTIARINGNSSFTDFDAGTVCLTQHFRLADVSDPDTDSTTWAGMNAGNEKFTFMDISPFDIADPGGDDCTDQIRAEFQPFNGGENSLVTFTAGSPAQTVMMGGTPPWNPARLRGTWIKMDVCVDKYPANTPQADTYNVRARLTDLVDGSSGDGSVIETNIAQNLSAAQLDINLWTNFTMENHSEANTMYLAGRRIYKHDLARPIWWPLAWCAIEGTAGENCP